jgi:hypothetical protein
VLQPESDEDVAAPEKDTPNPTHSFDDPQVESTETPGKSEGPEAAMLEAASSTAIFMRLLEDYYRPFELWNLRTNVEKVSSGFTESTLINIIDRPIDSLQLTKPARHPLLQPLQTMSSLYYRTSF